MNSTPSRSPSSRNRNQLFKNLNQDHIALSSRSFDSVYRYDDDDEPAEPTLSASPIKTPSVEISTRFATDYLRLSVCKN